MVFKNLLQLSKQVICMDAYLQGRTFALTEQFSKSRTPVADEPSRKYCLI